jgi:hypothetical protein
MLLAGRVAIVTGAGHFASASITLSTGRYIGDGDDAGEELAARIGEISDRTDEIAPAYGLLQSERELASARNRQPAAAASR